MSAITTKTVITQVMHCGGGSWLWQIVTRTILPPHRRAPLYCLLISCRKESKANWGILPLFMH